MRGKLPRWLFFAIIIVATVGAGIVDVACPDVIPLRPYTHTFVTFPSEAIGRSSIMYDVIIVSLIIFLVAALIRSVANQTTGIVISHAGFTPNPNITGSPGTGAVLQLFPLLFAFIGLAVWLRRRSVDAGV